MDVVVSACRDESTFLDYFYNTFGITISDEMIELPLAKIAYRDQVKKASGMDWYESTINKLIL